MHAVNRAKSAQHNREMHELISPGGVVIMRHPNYDRVVEAAVKLVTIYKSCTYTIRDTMRTDIV